MATTLANQFYTLNALIQNPLCGNAYAAMANYPEYIFVIGEEYKRAGKATSEFALKAKEMLRVGAELRSCGTYETIEEVTGRFSEFRGGCQLSLLAVEFLPYYFLKKLKIDWCGFIVTGDPKYYHLNEVINVPTRALWAPEEWWALYHEIGHVFLNNTPEIVDRNAPAIQEYLTNKNNIEKQLEFLNELAAEVIGFELGFFGDFDFFLKLVWKHVSTIDAYQKNHVPLLYYAFRTFFVELFEAHFRKAPSINKVSKDDFLDFDFMYDSFLKHLIRIEKIDSKISFPDKALIAAEHHKTFVELYPYAKHLFKWIKGLPLLPKKATLTCNNTKEVTASLKKGEIWLKEIDSPEAILFELFSRKTPLPFKTQMATVLTFWNQQMKIFKKRLEC